MNRELENKTNHFQLVGYELLEVMDNVLNGMSDEEFDKTFEEINETYPNAISADKYIELLEKHGNKVFNTENQ